MVWQTEKMCGDTVACSHDVTSMTAALVVVSERPCMGLLYAF